MKRIKFKNRILAIGCNLCGDNSQPLHLHAICHMTAPLRAELEDGVLTLYCYIPECNRVVARFRLATNKDHATSLETHDATR